MQALFTEYGLQALLQRNKVIPLIAFQIQPILLFFGSKRLTTNEEFRVLDLGMQAVVAING